MTMLKEASSFASDVTFAKPFQQQKSHLGKQQSTLFSERSTVDSIGEPEEKKKFIHVKKIGSFLKALFLKYWFLLGLVVVILLAWRFPNVARKKGHIRAEWSIKWGKLSLYSHYIIYHPKNL